MMMTSYTSHPPTGYSTLESQKLTEPSGPDAVEHERRELVVRLGIVHAGGGEHRSRLDPAHRRGDGVGDEGAVDTAEGPGRDPLVDQLADPRRGRRRVALVDGARRRVDGEVGHE